MQKQSYSKTRVFTAGVGQDGAHPEVGGSGLRPDSRPISKQTKKLLTTKEAFTKLRAHRMGEVTGKSSCSKGQISQGIINSKLNSGKSKLNLRMGKMPTYNLFPKITNGCDRSFIVKKVKARTMTSPPHVSVTSPPHVSVCWEQAKEPN